ncbi:hypothetical protein LCE35_20945 [Enterobacter kobei]|nr:hypothetical protein [Enterobacter kobei]MDS0026499.1 hypothetical protein [Enterobacter kobei]
MTVTIPPVTTLAAERVALGDLLDVLRDARVQAVEVVIPSFILVVRAEHVGPPERWILGRDAPPQILPVPGSSSSAVLWSPSLLFSTSEPMVMNNRSSGPSAMPPGWPLRFQWMRARGLLASVVD